MTILGSYITAYSFRIYIMNYYKNTRAPGVPKDRIKILRDAYAATYRDPKYLAEAKKARVLVGPISGENLTKLIQDIYSSPPELQAKLRLRVPPHRMYRAGTSPP